jgi:hypothetical protein
MMALKTTDPAGTHQFYSYPGQKKLTQSIAVYQKFVPKIKELKALECRIEKLPEG